MNVTKILAFTIATLMTGCTVDKQLTATGGSRADGIVELSYQTDGFAKVRIDWITAQSEATARCNAWGYKNAEKFGGEKQQCNAPSQYGCMGWFVTINYQCQ